MWILGERKEMWLYAWEAIELEGNIFLLTTGKEM